MQSKIFYTFMGLNLLLKGGVEKAKFTPPASWEQSQECQPSLQR
jgi:hypothetical protein